MEWNNSLKKHFKNYNCLRAVEGNTTYSKIIILTSELIINKTKTGMEINYKEKDIPFIIDMLYIITNDDWNFYEEININGTTIINCGESDKDLFITTLELFFKNTNKVEIKLNDIDYIFSLIFYVISNEKHDDYYLFKTLEKHE